MKYSIIIPNWNGLELLKKNFRKVLALDADEIIISDDGSTDQSLRFIEKNFLKDKRKKPKIIIVKHKRRGFAGNVNRGVQHASGDVIVLLNLDVAPRKDLLKTLEEHFLDPTVFGVSFNEINYPKFSWAKGYFLKGYIIHAPGKKTKEARQTFWISGGSGAFRKTMWDRLGGFDEDFKFYWEDIDLSYRAQKRGWKCIWDPKAKVIHKHGQSFRKVNKGYLSLIKERNHLLFIWKNLTDSKLFPKHLTGMLYRLKNPGYLKVILAALLKLPKIAPKRIVEREEEIISDRKLLNL
ncbi:glycosyltransferase family 2 protein [Patescibacteria group bacterium]|nr:glycosyltransferase family 2 protein [Patescibacteria group bacterium]